MPPKRSQQRKRPSATTLNAPQPRRSRRVASTSAGTSANTANVASTSTSAETTPPVSLPESFITGSVLPPNFLEQLVTTVTAEVTRRLTPTIGANSSGETATGQFQGSIVAETPMVSESNASTVLRSRNVPSAASEAATTMVHGALASAHAHISGEPQLLPATTLSAPTRLFQSVSLPIDARISIKVKNKIWSEEFVDFSCLLGNPLLESKFQISFQGGDSGQTPSLCLEPASKPKKFLNIEAWMNAFRIFVGVYTRKYPHEAPALMKYGDIVQDLAARGQNWRFYDENFRFLRQSQASALPWCDVHWELWLRSQYSQTQSRQNTLPRNQSNENKRRSLFVPRGYCFKFHNGITCSGCEYKHSCFQCEGMHKVQQCNFRGHTKTTLSKFSQSAKSHSPHANQNKKS